MRKTLLLLLFFCTTFVFPASYTEQNRTVDASTKEENTSSKQSVAPSRQKLHLLQEKKDNLDKELIYNNIWSKIYSNYHTFKELKQQEKRLKHEIEVLSGKYSRTKEEEQKLENLRNKKLILTGKLQLLKEYEKDPFKKFLTPPTIEKVPAVENPFAVISAFSYQEKLNSDQQEYADRYKSIQHVMKKLKEKRKLVNELLLLDVNKTKYAEELSNIDDQIKTFIPVLEIFKTTQNVYTKKIDEIKLKLQADIKREIEKAITIGAIILFFIIFILLVKYLVRRYMSDNDRFYTINKALNITFFALLLFTLLFAYIENVSYLVTILGFASAGIAIAMKDWFMSLMGWFVIIIGGAIHVGDRVKFVRGNVEYVGDIVDISLLRMTIQEDITLTTYMHNRRAGRIIFVPNNFIFTDMVANYSHAGLKTVWDGIDFVITFDSNVTKATSIAKEITKKYSKGYTDITRKQLNKLRSQYSMKNTNVEPRIYSFIEPYGIKISAWYHTNAYATLTLRSTISMEIIERLQREEDISLAFPTQSIYIDKDVRKPPVEEENLFSGEIS
jgi:small-conductance mechanosensitive channel